MHDQDQYRDLRRKIERIRSANQQSVDNEEPEEEGAKRKKKAGGDEITRGRQGIVMTQRNAFDFVEKPRQSEGFDQSREHSM